VLLVEDDLGLRRLVYHVLKRRCRVLEAADAAAAIAALDRGGVDMVLLDLHLPPRGDSPAEGLRVVDWIARTRRLPIVVVSGDQDPALPETLRRAGVKEFLPKPLDVERLLQVVADTLGGAAEAGS
jgi:two-component system KDP operon response regulator KdpE